MEGTNSPSILDIMDQIRAKNGQPSSTSSQKAVQPRGVAINAQKAIDEISDSKTRNFVQDFLTKEVKAPDLTNLRMVSFASKVGELRNTMTLTLNMIEANPIQRVTDLQVRFRERKVGEGVAQFFNIEDTFAPEVYSNRPVRDNTLGFAGQKVKIRMFAQEIGKQSPIESVNERQQQIEDAYNRIRRLFNKKIISNTEIKAETAGNIPQPGGFLTRSTAYNLALGSASDLTSALIEGRANAIYNLNSEQAYGLTPLVALCNGSQIGKIRDLMISRYPGETSTAALELTRGLLSKFASVNVPEGMFKPFLPEPGLPILFIYEPDLPSGTCLLFDPNQPQIGKMQLMGMFGPWALERPTEDLTTIDYIWDDLTLIDHLVESRAVITGLNNS